MRHIIILLIGIGCIFELNAQRLITSHIGFSSGYFNNNQGSMHYHVGEVCVAQRNGISEGVIQFIDLSTLTTFPLFDFKIKIYPNPTVNELFIQHNQNHQMSWIICNNQGQVLSQFKEDKQLMKIDCTPFPSGTYFLIPSIDDRFLNTYKFQIIK